jgi:hypothetical protein
MAAVQSVSEEFKTCVMAIFDDCNLLKTTLAEMGIKTESPDLSNIRFMINLALPSKLMAEKFATRSEHWNQIKTRSNTFLTTHLFSVLGEIPIIKGYVKCFQDMLNLALKAIDDPAISGSPAHSKLVSIFDEIWIKLNELVVITIRYADQERCPVLKGNQMVWSKNAFKGFKVKEIAGLWSVPILQHP